MRVIRPSGQDRVPMQQMQGQQRHQYTPILYGGEHQTLEPHKLPTYYRGAYNILEPFMRPEQQSTHASDSTGSSIPHQIPEDHQERTGGRTGLALVRMRPPGGEDVDSDGDRDDSSESEEATAYSAGDMLKNIVADRAFEEH